MKDRSVFGFLFIQNNSQPSISGVNYRYWNQTMPQNNLWQLSPLQRKTKVKKPLTAGFSSSPANSPKNRCKAHAC